MLFKPNTQRVLEALLKEDMSLEGLSGTMGFSKSNLKQRYLDGLEDMGLIEKYIKRSNVGREAWYRLRPFSLVLSIDPDSRSILSFSSHSILDLENPLLLQVGPDFREDIDHLMGKLRTRSTLRTMVMVLFGSVAKGNGTEKSDLDLLFLTGSKRSEDLVLDILSDISLDLHHRVDPIFMDKEDFLKDNRSLTNDIKENGIILSGNMDREAAVWRQMKRYANITSSA